MGAEVVAKRAADRVFHFADRSCRTRRQTFGEPRLHSGKQSRGRTRIVACFDRYSRALRIRFALLVLRESHRSQTMRGFHQPPELNPRFLQGELVLVALDTVPQINMRDLMAESRGQLSLRL